MSFSLHGIIKYFIMSVATLGLSGILMKSFIFTDRKTAFTLAEVLITLAIIGIVAAMTIPIITARTKQYEYRTGGKKAYSVLNNIIQDVALREDMTPEDYNSRTDAENEVYFNHIKSRLNSIKETTDAQGNTVYYTADGFRYHVVNSYTYYVDVDGDKKPTNIDTPKSDWKTAKYKDESDLFGLDWEKVNLSDMFYIYFSPDNGRSVILPYVQGVETIAAGANP